MSTANTPVLSFETNEDAYRFFILLKENGIISTISKEKVNDKNKVIILYTVLVNNPNASKAYKIMGVYYPEPSFDYIDHRTQCPRCGSSNIYYTPNGLLFFLFSVLLLFIPIFLRRRKVCFDCMNKWKVPIDHIPFELILLVIISFTIILLNNLQTIKDKYEDIMINFDNSNLYDKELRKLHEEMIRINN